MDGTAWDIEVLEVPPLKKKGAPAKKAVGKNSSSKPSIKAEDDMIILDDEKEAEGGEDDGEERGPKGLDFGDDPVGCRVRVEVEGGEMFVGTVGKYDKKEKEYLIHLDDGDITYSPMDETAWDVEVIALPSSSGKAPAKKRAKVGGGVGTPGRSKGGAGETKSKKKEKAMSDDSDDSDFIEEAPRKVTTPKGKKSAAATPKKAIGKSKKSDAGAGEAAGDGGAGDADGSTDFEDDKPIKPKKRAGGGKKKAVKDYLCANGCGFDGDYDEVAKHEEICSYVKDEFEWNSDMDEEEEEEFLNKWEDSVERRIVEKATPPPGLLMPLLPFQLER
jgi:hypothetical protein